METILSIAGKPGLYKLVSRGKMTLMTLTVVCRLLPPTA